MAAKDVQRRTDSGAAAVRAIRSGATWLGLVSTFAAGAGAGWLGARIAGPAVATETQAGAAIASDAEAAATLRDRMLALDPFVVNLLGEDATRYLKVRVELEAETPALRGELEGRMAQVRDGVLAVLSAHDVVDVTSPEGKTLLKDDIRARVNALLRGGQVRSVLFTEFVVQ